MSQIPPTRLTSSLPLVVIGVGDHHLVGAVFEPDHGVPADNQRLPGVHFERLADEQADGWRREVDFGPARVEKGLQAESVVVDAVAHRRRGRSPPAASAARPSD